MVAMTKPILQQHSDYAKCHQEFDVVYQENPRAYKDKKTLLTLESQTGVSPRNIKFWFRTMRRFEALGSLDDWQSSELERIFQLSALLDRDQTLLPLCSASTGLAQVVLMEWFQVRRRWLKIQTFIRSELPADRVLEELLHQAEEAREDEYRQSLEVEKMLQEEEDFQSSLEFLNLLQETEEMERKIARECRISFENSLSAGEFERRHPRYFTLSLAGPPCHPSDYDSNLTIFKHFSQFCTTLVSIKTELILVRILSNLSHIFSLSSTIDEVASESLPPWLFLFSYFTKNIVGLQRNYKDKLIINEINKISNLISTPFYVEKTKVLFFSPNQTKIYKCSARTLHRTVSQDRK